MQAADSAAFAFTHRPAVQPDCARGAPVFSHFELDEADDEIRIDLADLPGAQQSLEVDGFKPSVLSRLLDIIAPLGKR